MAGPNQPNQGGLQFRPPNRSSQIEQRDAKKRQDALQEVATQMGGNFKNRAPIDFDRDGLPVIDEPVHMQAPIPEQEQEEAPEPPAPKLKKIVKPANYEHPVVSKLLKNFGVKQDKYYSIQIFSTKGEDSGTKYTMSQASDEIMLWAVSDAQKQIAIKGETASISWYQCLITCASVVAMDEEPLYKVFSIKLNKDEELQLSSDQYDLSIRLKQLCGRALAEILWKKTRGVVEKLNDFYLGEVVGSNQVTSTYDQDIQRKERYVCPVDECSVVYIDMPPAEGEKYFCRRHGIDMIMAASIKEELDLPLP